MYCEHLRNIFLFIYIKSLFLWKMFKYHRLFLFRKNAEPKVKVQTTHVRKAPEVNKHRRFNRIFESTTTCAGLGATAIKKMKLTDTCLGKGSVKKFTNYKNLGYKYKVVRVPGLKDSVTSRKEKPQNAHCVNEMTRMMDCWKRSDFNQSACSKEAEVFMTCLAAAEAASKAGKGLPVTESTMRPSKQVNEMLAKYPQPKYNFID